VKVLCCLRGLLVAVVLLCAPGSLLAIGLLSEASARPAKTYPHPARASASVGARKRTSTPSSPSASEPHSARPLARARTAPSQGSAATAESPSRAPSGPPLSIGIASEQGPSASAAPSGEDVLVGNGLDSPLCHSPTALPTSVRQNCEIAKFVGASDPTGDYAFDVNVNTGIGEVGNDMAATIQNVVGFGWMAFVAMAHGLIVMLEWCYSLNLLSGSLLGEITRALHDSRLTFTEPWLTFTLAVAAVLAVYQGLVRRRVAETLGQALAMLAMMVGGLWVIADPGGTVGTLEQWVDQAALSTLAIVASGRPSQPQGTLAGDMQRLFGGVVTGPWCFLEFGQVSWCRDSGSLDPRLRAAALVIARREQTQSGCESLCDSDAAAKDRTLAASAALLREADTNGELFLALPANEVQRNSVTRKGALLNVLCGGGASADKCSGSTAAQAQFRSEKGTQQRVIGLVLIWIGGLGMLLLFGFIALHLLTATLCALFYLLLAPAAVLAPALGDGGRSAFRRWTMRLLEAVVAKLIYSFLLGVALMMTSALLDLSVLGWMAQWLLISSFWWTAFFKRGQMLGLIDGTARGAGASPQRSLAHRAKQAIETPRAALAPTRWAWRKLHSPAPDAERRRERTRRTHQAALTRVDEQVTRTLDHDLHEARLRMRVGPQTQALLSAHRDRLQRVQRERRRALSGGVQRRAAKLAVRERRIEGEIAREQHTLNDARRTSVTGARTRRADGSPSTYTHEQYTQRKRFLDEQAALPAHGRRTPDGGRRDYAATASLIGHGRDEYERMDPPRRRRARLQIDRELALRSRFGEVAKDVARDGAPTPRRSEQGELDRALEQRMRNDGHTPHRAHAHAHAKSSTANAHLGRSRPDRPRRAKSSAANAHLGRSAQIRDGVSASKSQIMDDAREVASGRKRQLGSEHPR
jgi:hypothetical protein